eukprot:3798168-Rhodomonas_salina.2
MYCDCPNRLFDLEHCYCPFCALHASMRVSEKLLAPLQEHVIRQGGDAAVSAFNTRMREMKTGFRIKSAGRDAAIKFKAPGVNGTAALRCTHQADAVLDEIFGPASLLSDSDAAFVDRSRAVWKAWGKVLDTMVAMRPSEEQIQRFQSDVFAFMVALQATYHDPPEEYFHTIYAHASEYLHRLGSLGLYMNQGAESQHKEGCLAWVQCCCCGVQGRPAKKERTIRGIKVHSKAGTTTCVVDGNNGDDEEGGPEDGQPATETAGIGEGADCGDSLAKCPEEQISAAEHRRKCA